MDPIVEKLNAIEWEYGDKDPRAISELRSRIEETGRKFRLISYTDLVRGVDFHYPNIKQGGPFRINTHEWSGLDGRIVGDCLGFISRESYLKHKFMASALVIARLESKPSDLFFEWMKTLGALPNLSESAVLTFWVEQVKRAHHWYKYGKEL